MAAGGRQRQWFNVGGLPKPPVVWNAIEHMMLITAEVTGAPQPPRGKLNLLSSVATGPETYPRCTTVQRSLLIPLIFSYMF